MKLILNFFVMTMVLSTSAFVYSEETQDMSTIQDISKEPVSKLLNILVEEKHSLRDYIQSNSSCIKTDKETVLSGAIEGHFRGLFSYGELKGWIEGKAKTTGQAEIFICAITIPSKTSEQHYEKLTALSAKSHLAFSHEVGIYANFLKNIMKNKKFVEDITSKIEGLKKITDNLETRMIKGGMTSLQRSNFLELKEWYQGTKLIVLKHNPDKIYNPKSGYYYDCRYTFNFVESSEDRSYGGGCSRRVSLPPAIYIMADAVGYSDAFLVTEETSNVVFLDFLLNRRDGDNDDKAYAVEPCEFLFY